MKLLLPVIGLLLLALAARAVTQEPGSTPPMQTPVTDRMTFDEEFDRTRSHKVSNILLVDAGTRRRPLARE